MKKDGGQGRQGGAGRTHGSAEPVLAPVQVHFGGKSDLILLKAVMNVSMYKLGGNRPQGAIKGASLHTLNTHHLEASFSHSLVTCMSVFTAKPAQRYP